MRTDEDSHCGVTTESTTKSTSQVHVRAVQQRVPVRVAMLSNSTAVAASFLTAIMTPPEVQMTLYNSLVLRAAATATFPLLFRIFTSYSVHKPQRHPYYFLYTPRNIFRCAKKTHSSARISAILPLSSFCSVSAVLPSCPALAGGDHQLSSTSHVCCER